MRALPLLSALLLVAGVASARGLEERYRAKMAKEFVKRVPWETDLRTALARAKKEEKIVVAYFTRSYAP